MNLSKSRPSYIYLVVTLGLLLCYAYFSPLRQPDFRPYYGDELFYVQNSRSFAGNSNMEAVFTYTGYGSSLGGFDAHGPTYPLFYGTLAKITGWSSWLIPTVNLLIFGLALVLIWYQKEPRTSTRALQILLVFGSPISIFYSMSFMPELLHLAGGVFLFLQFRRYHRLDSQAELLKLVGLILLLGLFRSTWFFAFTGLMVSARGIRWRFGLVLLIFGLGMAFIFQTYFHEPVPNSFSQSVAFLKNGEYLEALATILKNLKRNTYFLFTYSEGVFYSVQKVWLWASVALALVYYRTLPLVRIALILFATIFVFNMVLYKNYSWVDLRMYTPVLLFLNLSMLASSSEEWQPKVLLGLNLISFVLILPLCERLLYFRTHLELEEISPSVAEELQLLQQPMIFVDSLVIENYQLDQLPISGPDGQALTYILPYYEVDHAPHTHILEVISGQLRVRPVKILSQ